MSDPVLDLMLRAGICTEHRDDIRHYAQQVSGFDGGSEHAAKVQRASFVMLQVYVKGASSQRAPGLPSLGHLAAHIKDGLANLARELPSGAAYDAGCTALVMNALTQAAEVGAQLQAAEVATLQREKEEAREEGYNRGWRERDMGIPVLERRAEQKGRDAVLQAVRDGGPALGSMVGLEWVHETRLSWLDRGKKNADFDLEMRVNTLEADLAEARAQSLDGFQEACLRTWNRGLSPRDALMNAALGLAGEAGEVADLAKKVLCHGKPLDPEKMALEDGDVLFYVAVTATVLGKRLSEVAKMNVAKLWARFPEGWSEAAAAARVDVVEEPCPGCGQPKPVGQACQRLVCVMHDDAGEPVCDECGGDLGSEVGDVRVHRSCGEAAAARAEGHEDSDE